MYEMAKQARTYFLCPHFDYPPSSIKLGHIIPSPSKPSNALNLDEVVPVDESQVTSTYQPDFAMHSSSAGLTGILPRFLEVFGFGNERGGHDEIEDEFKCDGQDTTLFCPTGEYLNLAVQAEGVQMYLSGCRFRKPLYVVTGLKIARGGRSSRTTTRQRTAGLDVGVDTGHRAVTGVPVTVWPGIQVASSWSDSKSFQSEVDFVFAFRLQRFSVRQERTLLSTWSPKEPALPSDLTTVVKLEDIGTGALRDVVADEMLDDNKEQSYVVILYSAESYPKGMRS